MLYSFWWPQVVHSAYTGRRHPFHSLYLYGTSVLRVLLPLYLLVCPNNMFVMLVEYFSPQYDLSESAARKEVLDLPTAWFLCAYVVLQVIVLELQTRWGPRFFIPSSWVPQRYNYHRPVPPALLGSHHDAAEVTAADANSQSGIAMTLFSSSSGASGDYHRLPTSEDSVPAANAPMDVGDEESGALHSPMECVICYNSIYLNTRQQYMVTHRICSSAASLLTYGLLVLFECRSPPATISSMKSACYNGCA